KIYRVLRSPIFEMSDKDAKEMMRRCFTEESEGLQRSFSTHQEAMKSYQVYVEKLDYIWQRNRNMSLMATNSISRYLETQKRAFQGFEHQEDLFLTHDRRRGEWKSVV
ncbi:MAG: P-aminobenzoate N-oxygenase AurF, partial [Nostoc sp. NMS4]|nr:P-aminobenzoate N-oxygenase AurF [Nostoc sp. NMS4]